jgi:quercetin 2,3-dioxygenase
MKRVATEKTGQARIYLEGQRGCTQTAQHRSLHTFDFGSYAGAERGPFNTLQTLNDETLAPGGTRRYHTQTNGMVAVIPLVGACVCTVGSRTYTPDAGQVLIKAIHAGEALSFQNPYAEDYINYLVLEIRDAAAALTGLTEAELDKEYNTLHRLAVSPACHIHLGVFLGREEVALSFDEAGKHIFVFVLEGAFEVNNRLLHRRDGLALSNCPQLECEALSNHAMMVVVELF